MRYSRCHRTTVVVSKYTTLRVCVCLIEAYSELTDVKPLYWTILKMQVFYTPWQGQGNVLLRMVSSTLMAIVIMFEQKKI